MKLVIKSQDLQIRNPVARAMRENAGQFRKQTIRDRKKYNRKQKHKKGAWE